MTYKKLSRLVLLFAFGGSLGATAAETAIAFPVITEEKVKASDAEQKKDESKPSEKIAGTQKAEEEEDEADVVVAGDPTEEEESEETDEEKADAQKDAENEEAAEANEKEEAPAAPDVDASPLTSHDFLAGGIRLGLPYEETVSHLGKPQGEKRGAVRSEYIWPAMAVRFVSEMAAKYDETLKPGVDAIYIADSKTKTNRGIAVGDAREHVLRLYGRPTNVLWDGTRGLFHFLYQKDDQLLVFSIAKDKVKDIRITYDDGVFAKPYPESLFPSDQSTDERDYRIAGYRLLETFAEHSWESWQRKATNAKEEIRYYPGYGLHLDIKSHRIGSMFLSDARMLTARGLAVGDQISTMEAVYGKPDKLEVNYIEKHPQTAYIYFSPDKDEVLILYINDKARTVQSIVVMNNPLGPRAERSKIDPEKAKKEEKVKKEKEKTEDKKETGGADKKETAKVEKA